MGGSGLEKENKRALFTRDATEVVVVVGSGRLRRLVRLLPEPPLVGRPVPLVERLDLGPRAGRERVVQALLDRAEDLLDRDRRRPLAVPRPVGLVQQIEADAPAGPHVQVPEDLWEIKFGRPTAKRYLLRSCVCSMALIPDAKTSPGRART